MKRLSLCSALCISLLSAPVSAEVTLRDSSGTVSITGKLLSFENDVYTLESVLGVIEIKEELVECIGEECPVIDRNQIIRIAASDAFSKTLFQKLFASMADEAEARFVEEADTEIGKASQLIRADDKIIATLQTNTLGANQSFDALLNGDAEIIFTERRASEADVERFLDAGLGDLRTQEQELIFGLDGVVFLVAPENPVKSVSLEALEGIFSGRITNWSEVGGADVPIKAFAPDAQSSISQYFQAAVLDQNFSEFAPDIFRTSLTEDVSKAVATDLGAIGLSSIAYKGSTRALPVASACGILSNTDEFTLRSEDYPMSRRIYAYVANRERPSRTDDLLALLGSPEGQSILENAGFISLTGDTAGLESFGRQLAYSLASPEQAGEIGRLRNFASEVIDADRLPTTFRFSSGSSQLDNKARSDATRLLELLKQDDYSDREVLLVGFTDSIGTSSVNALLSQRRAQQVVDEIAQASDGTLDLDRFQTLGYGASYPVACNTDEVGRELNRRVEVWLR